MSLACSLFDVFGLCLKQANFEYCIKMVCFHSTFLRRFFWFKKGYYGNEGLGVTWDRVRSLLKVNFLRDFGAKKRRFFSKKKF